MALADHTKPTGADGAPAYEAPTPLFAGPVDLGHAVTAALREMILNGAAAPGQRLVETELSERFGTSRGPIRDAFKELEQSGLVVSVPRRGTFVATLTPDDIDEIYTLRLALERLAITQAATRATDNDLDALRDAVALLEDAQRAGDRQAGAEADIAIHRLIVRAAGHERLIEAWERLADQTLLIMAELIDLLPDVQRAAGDHETLVNAVAEGNAAAAEEALEEHLQAAREAMIEHARTRAATTT